MVEVSILKFESDCSVERSKEAAGETGLPVLTGTVMSVENKL